MIKVLFFAHVRELVGCDELSLPSDYPTAEQRRAALCERGDKWARAPESRQLREAVNQTLVPLATALGDDDEVTLYPPAPGG